MTRWQWSVSYETARVAFGFADDKLTAERAAMVEHDRLAERLCPEKLAWHVGVLS